MTKKKRMTKWKEKKRKKKTKSIKENDSKTERIIQNTIAKQMERQTINTSRYQERKSVRDYDQINERN